MQIIVMASEPQYPVLRGFDYLLNKYLEKRSQRGSFEYWLCIYAQPPLLLSLPWKFYSIGEFEDYPPKRWSDSFLKVLDDVAQEQFILLLEDYWITRPADVLGIEMCFDYLRQFKNTLKIDLAFDRLYINGGSTFYGGDNDYAYLGHLDLIKSPAGTPYQMSLWGGVWNRDVMRDLIIPGEAAQDIEISGTNRLHELGEDVMVLGTRQAPLRHGNIYQSRHKGKPVYRDSGWAISEADLEHMRNQGWIE